jgi:hypothetical protein
MSGTTSAPGADSPGVSFTYFVLGAAPGRQPQDLLRDYLSMEWVHGTPTAPATAYDGQAITAADLSRYRVPEAPPVLTLQPPRRACPRIGLFCYARAPHRSWLVRPGCHSCPARRWSTAALEC